MMLILFSIPGNDLFLPDSGSFHNRKKIRFEVKRSSLVKFYSWRFSLNMFSNWVLVSLSKAQLFKVFTKLGTDGPC